MTFSRSIIFRAAIRHRQFALSYSSRTARIGNLDVVGPLGRVIAGCRLFELAVAATMSV